MPSNGRLRQRCSDAEVAVGEVFVEGPSVTAGYWDDEEATNRVFVDGGVRTGAVGD